jgi:3-hydroxyacyl-CoA dehydrogenase / enoyl-CoA hydratase / 3-hydroxybutyryl-CoA epimerase
MYIYRVGVIGAGTMGAQIAQVVSFAGIPVVMTDVTQAAAERGLETVRKIYQARVQKGKMTLEQVEQKLLLVTVAVGLDALKEVDIAIEAASEDMRVKQHIFQELDRLCSAGAILATNTSALSISAIGSATKRAGKVIGLHFFNPAYAMPLVEVIPGMATDQQTIDDAVGFAETLRKAPIVVRECAGFLVNRLLMPYLNEAVHCLQEGLGTLKEIDEEMVKFGMPVGPFSLLDSVGLDISCDVARILHKAYGPRMAPAVLLEEMVKAGRLGIKSGQGFYAYEGTDPEASALQMEKMIHAIGSRTRTDAAKSVRSRLLLAMLNEAVIALQEGVASARDIDLAMMAGTGFPTDKEGPLHYADHIGIDQALQQLEEMTETIAPRFWPAPMLRRMVDAGFLGQTAGRGFFSYHT